MVANDNADLTFTQSGRVAEFIVCADITRRGYYAMHVDAPGFDVLLVRAAKSFRVQVKSSSTYRSGKLTWRCRTHATSERGNLAKARAVNANDADIVALYHHDFDGVIYLPISQARDRINIPPDRFRLASKIDTIAASIEAPAEWKKVVIG